MNTETNDAGNKISNCKQLLSFVLSCATYFFSKLLQVCNYRNSKLFVLFVTVENQSATGCKQQEWTYHYIQSDIAALFGWDVCIFVVYDYNRIKLPEKLFALTPDSRVSNCLG